MYDSEETIFEIILHGGNARSLAMEAITCAKKADFATAKKKMAEAEEELSQAHHIQTMLIQQEAGGKKQRVSLLLVHAQDHLMNAITVKDLAGELVSLYEQMQLTGDGAT